MEKSASQSASKKMAPTRKQRRKAPNLLQSYTRRQRQHAWLETHIWHTKRMKMVDKYGYRLAEHSNDKGIRATYRSLMYGCLLSVSHINVLILHFFNFIFHSCVTVGGRPGNEFHCPLAFQFVCHSDLCVSSPQGCLVLLLY